MQEQNWRVYAKKADFKEIGEKYHISPVIARIIRNRDIIGDDEINRYLNGTLEDLHDPHLLGGAGKGAAILAEKIRSRKKIRVIGDYDCDGVCSTYILFTAIKELGGDVSWDIPERIRDGYGLNERIVNQAAADGVDTIITCDNGIAAAGPVECAKNKGMTVIVTDHHEVQTKNLPKADALIDPKIPGDTYPFDGICGAVVAWKVVTLLYDEMDDETHSLRERYKKYLPFAALPTVTDVMELRNENRIIVKYGLKAFQNTDNIGLRALICESGLENRDLSAYHFGFVIGPCINSAGRLSTACDSLRLLLEKKPEAARAQAVTLVSLNNQRKLMTEEGLEKAIGQIETAGRKNDKVFVVYLPDMHESIAGLIAGKIREKYNHPVFVLTKSDKEGTIKGSGRSIEAYNMFEALEECSEYLLKYGGHKMAAGITLREDALEAFRQALNEKCTLKPENFIPRILIDVPLPLGYISEELIRQLDLIEPCGNGNTKPIFGQLNVPVKGARFIGQVRRFIRFRLADPVHGTMNAIYFGDSDEMMEYLTGKFGRDEVDRMMAGMPSRVTLSITYYPQVSEYRSLRSLQIIISNYR